MIGQRAPGREQWAEPALTPDSIPLSRYTGLARRYLGLAALLLAIGLVLGGLKLAVSPRSYTSTVDVLAPPVALHAGVPRSAFAKQEEERKPKETTMDTEAEIVYSSGVMNRLRDLPGFQLTRKELKKRITITVPTYTHVLSIAVRAGDPGHALRAAQVIARNYIAVRQQIMSGIQQRNLTTMQSRLTAFREQLKLLPGEEKEFTRETARTRRQEILKEIGDTEKEMSALETKAVQPGEVVRDPRRPDRPDGLGGEVALTTGIGAGLLVWLLIANARDRRPRRIRRPADIRLGSRVPILVESPIVGGGHRHLCRRLRNMVFEEEAAAVLVVGVPEGSAAEIARELAELCAEAGSVTTWLRAQEVPAARADARAVDGRVTDARAVAHADGDLPLHTHVISTEDGDRELNWSIAQARKHSDIVVITTYGLQSADTVSAAAACDLVFVAAQRGRALDHDLARGIAELDHAALPASGIVLTGPVPVGAAP